MSWFMQVPSSGSVPSLESGSNANIYIYAGVGAALVCAAGLSYYCVKKCLSKKKSRPHDSENPPTQIEIEAPGEPQLSNEESQ